MLPKIDGISLCEKLRAHNYSMPVLMLTARDRSTDIVKGFNAGADDYLVKPYGMELCRSLRSDRHWNHLPVLFLTVHQDLETQNQAFYIGLNLIMGRLNVIHLYL